MTTGRINQISTQTDRPGSRQRVSFLDFFSCFSLDHHQVNKHPVNRAYPYRAGCDARLGCRAITDRLTHKLA